MRGGKKCVRKYGDKGCPQRQRVHRDKGCPKNKDDLLVLLLERCIRAYGLRASVTFLSFTIDIGNSPRSKDRSFASALESLRHTLRSSVSVGRVLRKHIFLNLARTQIHLSNYRKPPKVFGQMWPHIWPNMASANQWVVM